MFSMLDFTQYLCLLKINNKLKYMCAFVVALTSLFLNFTIDLLISTKSALYVFHIYHF